MKHISSFDPNVTINWKSQLSGTIGAKTTAREAIAYLRQHADSFTSEEVKSWLSTTIYFTYTGKAKYAQVVMNYLDSLDTGD